MASKKNVKNPPEAHSRSADPQAPAGEAAGPVRIDPAASAALAEAIRSAKPDATPDRPAPASIAPAAKSPRGFGSSTAAQAAMAVALIGAGWVASYAGTLGNREAIHRVEAETARSQEILARLTDDLEALKGTLASFRDVEQTASVAKASDQANLADKVERLTVAVQVPDKKLSAVEARLDRMEGQIMASLASLAAKPAAPPPPAPPAPPAASPSPTPPPAPAAAAPAPAPAVTEAAVREPAPAPKPSKNDPIDGWTLREVYDGAALIESQNRRLYEVMPGGFIPGLGRVEAIERRGRSWVVLTDKGTISATR